MRKNKFRLAALLALAAAVFCQTALAAGEDADPGYSDAVIQAAPTVSAEGAVEQSGLLSVTVALGEGSTAAKASIQTTGLQYLRTDGIYASQNGVALLTSAPTAVYYYKVTAAPGQYVEFRLTDAAVVIGNSENEEAAPGAMWTARVTGESTGTAPPPPSQTQDPSSPATPTAPSLPTEPVVIRGDAAIEIGGTVTKDETIKVTVSTQADGLQGIIETEGLEFVSVDNRFCSSTDVILVNNTSGTGARAVYTYVVTAAAGRPVSVDISHVTISRNGADVAGTSSAWIGWSVAKEPTGTIAVANGLALTQTPSGQKVITGLTATRYGIKAGEFRRYVTVPSGSQLEITGAQGSTLTDDDLITTGSQVRAVKPDGSVLDSAVVSLLGDVSGSGTANIVQLVSIAKFLNGTAFPSELEVLSSDFNKDGAVGITDLVMEAAVLH